MVTQENIITNDALEAFRGKRTKEQAMGHVKEGAKAGVARDQMFYARYLLEQCKKTEALDWLERVTDNASATDALRVEANLAIGSIHYADGYYDHAKPWLNKAAEFMDAEAQAISGDIHRMEGSFYEALNRLSLAASAGNDNGIRCLHALKSDMQKIYLKLQKPKADPQDKVNFGRIYSLVEAISEQYDVPSNDIGKSRSSSPKNNKPV